MNGRRWSRIPGLAAALTALTLAASCVDTGPTGPLQPAERSLRAEAATDGFTGNIRIGVVPVASSVTIGSDDSFLLRAGADGEAVLNGSGGEIVVTIDTPPEVTSSWWLQVVYTTSQAYIDDWISRATALGYETMIEQHPTLPGQRLLLGKWPASATFSQRVGYENTAIEQGLAQADAFWRSFSVAEPGTVALSYNGTSLIATAPVILEVDSVVRIAGARYRGAAEVGYNSHGTLAGINELPIEQYLYGVVPWELPPVPYDELEAQKAQAVAARTYALGGLGKRRADGYDLLPTTTDQVYGGLDAEHPVSTAAVDGTAGIVATFGGTFAQTLYHSTSGGFTANNEDVYNSDPVSYLRGKPDAERGKALAHAPSHALFKRAANPTNLRAAANGDFEADWSRYHRWVVEWSAEEMAQVLSASFDVAVDSVIDIQVTDRADQGRVREIVFTTDAGNLAGVEDQIRSRLRYVTASGDFASLRSTLFYIEPVVEPQTGAVTGWIAYGGGWGHGVGMSQTGAVGMAEKGRTYEEILQHYYSGVELVEWY